MRDLSTQKTSRIATDYRETLRRPNRWSSVYNLGVPTSDHFCRFRRIDTELTGSVRSRATLSSICPPYYPASNFLELIRGYRRMFRVNRLYEAVYKPRC